MYSFILLTVTYLLEVEMSNIYKTTFAHRFRAIRNSHKLTMIEMAKLLGYKRNSSISMIETGNSTISLDVMIKMNLIFAISTDWLIGVSEDIYTESVMIYREKEANFFNNQIGNNQTLLDIVPNEYFWPSDRSKFYNLKERANIVFLAYYLDYMIKNMPEIQTLDYTLTSLEKTIYNAKSILNRNRNDVRFSKIKFIAHDFNTKKILLYNLLNSSERFTKSSNNILIPSKIDLSVYDIANELKFL